VELAAIADSHSEARNEFGDRFGVPDEHRYHDYRELLDREHLDIVSICSWHPQHAPMTIAAAARRPKAVLCEKPMATCLKEADEMLLAARRNGVKLAIGHMRRFYTGWEEARRLVAAGAIGEPRRLWSVVAQGLLNWGTHAIDGVRFVLGDPPAQWVMGNVERKSDRYERATRIEDACLGLVQFACTASLPASGGELSQRGQPFQPEDGPRLLIESDLSPYASINFRIEGTAGLLHVNENHVRLFNAETGGWRTIETEQNDPFVAQAREVARWAGGEIGDQACRIEGQQGRATLEIMMALFESARRHEVVRLPLQTRLSPLDLMVEAGDLPVERPGAYDIRSFLVRGEAMQWKMED